MTIIRFRVQRYKGISLMSLLVALTLFSGIFFAMTKWTEYQRGKATEIYQMLQATQIAEGQKQRLLFGLPCQSRIQQNRIIFYIRCSSASVIVRSRMSVVKL